MPKKKDEVVEVQPEAKVEEMSKDIKKYEKKVESIEVKSEDDFAKANVVLVELKSRINRINELEKQFNDPHKEIRRVALAAMNKNTETFASPLAQYTTAYNAINGSMSTFRLAENKRIAEEEAVAKKKQDEEEAKVAEAAKAAEEKGEDAPAPAPAPAPTPRAVISKVAKTQKVEGGSSTSKNVIKFEIEDILALPKKYRDLILEDSLKRGHAKTLIDKFVKVEGLKFKVKGVRVYEDVDISVKTK